MTCYNDKRSITSTSLLKFLEKQYMYNIFSTNKITLLDICFVCSVAKKVILHIYKLEET